MIFGAKTPQPEDPKKLDDFKQKLLGLSWEAGKEIASIKGAFEAVDALANSEVLYYYSERRSRSRLSGWLRFFSWLFGTVGILLPLLATAYLPSSAGLMPWGYVALAIAASLLTANALFGASTGHIRFVTAQLSLEKLMTSTDWSGPNLNHERNLRQRRRNSSVADSS
jgi:hypothetical protein